MQTLAESGGLEQELLEAGRGFSSTVDELPPVPGVGVHGGQLRGSDRGRLVRRVPRTWLLNPGGVAIEAETGEGYKPWGLSELGI